MILSTHGIVGSQITQFVGLLDAYPSAAAAYSLRKLRSAYTGSAIRVRRASDNTEQDIGFVNNVLDTSSLTSFCSGTNGFVKTWYDQSGNGRDATQTTAANQPQIVSSGSVILKNGKPIVLFDGINNNYYLPIGINLQNITLVNVSEYSVSGRQIQTYLRTTSSPDYISTLEYSTNTTLTTQDFHRSTSGDFTKNIAAIVGNQYLNFSVFSQSVHELYQNGNGSSSTGGVRNSSNYNFAIAAGLSAGGNLDSFRANTKIQEIIIYTTDQSSNRTGIETNIAQFYDITLS